MPVNLNHLQVSLLFALFSSVVLGIVTKNTKQERIRYGMQCFGYFMLALFAIGWTMRIMHG